MRTLVTITLLLTFCGCNDMSNGPTPVQINTPDGNVVAHKSTVDPTPQQINAVTGDELKHLESLAAQAPSFAAAYLGDKADPDLKDYDEAFRVWQTSKKPQHSNDQVVEIIGGYLGNKCIADFDMEWVTVTDEFGTDYAVRGKTVDVMSFPFSTVLKRIEKSEHGFLFGVYHATKQMLESGDYRSRETESSKN